MATTNPWLAAIRAIATSLAAWIHREQEAVVAYQAVMDRDPVFTQEFRARLEHAGIEPVRLPRCSPNLNAYVERFNRSIQEECLDRVVPLGEAHLRKLVREYVAHYHEERPHQGLDGDSVLAPIRSRGEGRLGRRERLGGLQNHYYREAA